MLATKTPKSRRKKWADEPKRPQYKFRRLQNGLDKKDWMECRDVLVEYVPEQFDRAALTIGIRIPIAHSEPIRCSHGSGNVSGGKCIVTTKKTGEQFGIGLMCLATRYEPVDEDGYTFLHMHGIGRGIHESVDQELHKPDSMDRKHKKQCDRGEGGRFLKSTDGVNRDE